METINLKNQKSTNATETNKNIKSSRKELLCGQQMMTIITNKNGNIVRHKERQQNVWEDL